MRYALLLVALLACKDSTGPITLVGSYALTEADRKPLPAKTSSGLVVTSGTMVLHENGTFTETFRIGGSSIVETGTYTVNSSVASFVTYYGYRYTGVVENDGLVSTDGSLWPTRYRRE